MQKLQRWYKGFYYSGSPKKLLEQISNQVQEQSLSQVIPLLRIEKVLKNRQQFCFFLAIESAEKGEIPIEISQSYLLKLNYFKKPIPRANLNYEQIKPMVGIAHDVHDYTHNIPYKISESVTYDNPFDFISSSTPSSSSNNTDLSQQYEGLLYWLSALGAGSWDSFKKACESLELPEPRRIARRLKLLGHLELSANGLKWSMSPTALVKVNSQSDNQEFVLCGQRSQKLLQQLEQFATVKQNNGDSPPCIQLANSNLIESLNSEFSIIDAGNASIKLAEILPNIDTWQQNLRNLQGIVPSLYEWQYFDGHKFVDCVSPKEKGLYQYKREANNNISGTVFYDKPNDKWLQGDWYGLRFLALHNQDISVHYDKTKESLAIPLEQRWPEIYERALVLASGLLPRYQRTEQSWWLVYEGISLELATQLTDKLGISLHNND